MSTVAAAAAAAAPAKKGLIKTLFGGIAGLLCGGLGVYTTTVITTVAKPNKPVANFSVAVEGLKVTCQNHAAGQSGWWDFGDGTPLEPFSVDEQSIVHTYAKPGNYAIKLTVRNFLMDENERTVPVELSGGQGTAAGAVTIPNFSVEAIGGVTTAPATFRIRGEVKNADRVIWDTGSEQLEVADAPGAFEKLIVFEKPGPYQLQLIGYSGKQAVKKAAQVNVSEARSGTLSAVLRVTDRGTQVTRREYTETVAVPVAVGNGPIAIERTIPARPGHTIAQVRPGKVPATVQGLKFDIAPDKSSVKLSAQVARTDGKAGDVLIPLTLVQDQAIPLPSTTETIAVQLVPEGSFILQDSGSALMTAILPLPPQPASVNGLTRTLQFELREVTPLGQTRVIGALPDIKLPFRGMVKLLDGKTQIVDIQQTRTGQVKVQLSNPTGRS